MNNLSNALIEPEYLDFDSARLDGLRPVITADFMRPLPGLHSAKSGMQNTIAGKLLDWLQPAMVSVFDRPATLLRWDDDADETLPVSAIYDSHDFDPSTFGWTNLYGATPTPEAIALLRPHFSDSFVIGFELSPYIRRALNTLSVPFVSLAIHPLRFMTDYKFMIASNLEAVENMTALAYDRADIAFAAQLKRADMLAGNVPDLADGCAVLFGQVEVDAALIGPGGVVSLQDHMPQIRDLADRFGTVYFKPHPYAARAGEQASLLRQFDNFEFITENPYALLSSPRVDTVAALTSSVLTEAAYFGKNRMPLAEVWQDRTEEPVFGIEVLSAPFWKALLAFVRGATPDLSRLSRMRPLTGTSVKSLLNVSWETHGKTEIPETGIELPLGRQIDFGADSAGDALCVGTGWKAASGGHRWAGPEGAYLSFRIPPSVTTDLSARLSVTALASEAHPILVQLICRDQILAEQVLSSRATVEIAVDLPASLRTALGDMQIEIRSSHGHSPKFISGGSDRRALSLAVKSLQLKLPSTALFFSIGETIRARDFDRDAPFLTQGWHRPEAEGIWTAGRQSRLTVATSTLPDNDLVLKLGNVRALLSDLVPMNNLIVRVGGKRCRRVKFERGQPGDLARGGIDITVPLSREVFCTERGTAQIDFEVVACHSPALAELSRDTRELGLFFDSLQFSSVITDIATRPSEHVANVFGPFNIHTGLAVMARNCFLSIQEAMDAAEQGPGAPAALKGPRAVNFNNSRHLDEDTGFVMPDATGSDINIFNGDVTRIARMVSQNGAEFLQGRHNICYGAWELETLPTYLADTRYIDEYWGLSTFIADAARKRMDVPVHAFPIPVDLHFPETLRKRAHFNIPDEAFAFLFTFSVDSTMARKNPEAVLQAFQEAFPDPREPVVLVIKSMIRQASKRDQAAFKAFRSRALKDPRVRLIETTLSRDDNASLYMCSDAYVSLHRAEGFGLTMAEAMGYGKPTIGTGYSGNLDFMNADNACLVKFDRVEMDPESYHGQQRIWAEPDVFDAAQHMRRVYEDILFREKIARAGKRTIYEEFSKISVGRKLLDRITEIREARA